MRRLCKEGAKAAWPLSNMKIKVGSDLEEDMRHGLGSYQGRRIGTDLKLNDGCQSVMGWWMRR